jgi:hypothetical protein
MTCMVHDLRHLLRDDKRRNRPSTAIVLQQLFTKNIKGTKGKSNGRSAEGRP